MRAPARAASGTTPAPRTPFVDPTFTIDPAYAAFYALVGIPGEDAVGTPPDTGPGGSSNGVPEPSTVWLLFLGVAILGVVGRQRSQVGRLASLLRRAARPFDRSGHAERRALVGWS